MPIIFESLGVLPSRLEAVGRVVAVVFCLAVSLASTVTGQSLDPKGVAGQVTFPAGTEKLPRELVRVALSNNTGAVLREIRLKPDGSFDLGRVRHGRYTVTVSSPGFRTTRQEVDVLPRSYQVRVEIALGPRVEPEGSAKNGPDHGDETVSVAALKIPQKAQKELEKGRQRLGKGSAEKALKHFDKALTLCSGCFEAYEGLGSSYSSLGRWPEAEEAFGKLIELDPQNPAPRRQLAQVYLRQKSFEAALDQLRLALAMEPNSGKTQVLLGESYLGLQDCGTALNYFQTASQMNPGEHSCLGLGRSLYCAGRNMEALAEFKEFVDENPADPRSETVRQFIVDLEKAIRTGGRQ